MEKHMKKALEQGVKELTPSKDQVWKAIMDKTTREGSNTRNMSNNKSKKPWGWASAAAAVLVTVFFISAPGQAAIQRVIDLFSPEIQIIEDLEGQPEETDASLAVGRAGYIIYFDTDRYELIEMEDRDKIVPILEGDTSYLPDVYMEIRQVIEKSPEAVAEELEKQLQERYLQGESEFEVVENHGAIEDPLAGILIVAQGDVASDNGVVGFGPVEMIYLVDNEQGGTFVIRQMLFHEAVEGHGQRFNSMLRHFTVVELEES